MSRTTRWRAVMAAILTALTIAVLALAPSVILADGIGWRDLLTALIVVLSIAQTIRFIRLWWVSRQADRRGEHPSGTE